MIRRALIIGNPGTRGKENYCQGVTKDIANYKAYLKSPLGGMWNDDEINVLDQPNKYIVNLCIGLLHQYDYTMTIFCGHGYHSNERSSTILELKPDTDYIDSMELRRGASKHILILDCCRRIERPSLFAADALEKALKEEVTLNQRDCRRYYEEGISKCPTGLVTLFACSIGETAGDSSAQGGYYSYSLMNAAETWRRETSVDTSKHYRLLSIVDAHGQALPGVRGMSGDRQNPSVDKPRSGPYFPFGIIA